MGAKSRGNWKLGYCMRVDCLNRTDDVCAECFRFSKYRSVNEDAGKDTEGSGTDMREDVPRR